VTQLAVGFALEPERLHRITGGNAFYVTEVLAAPGWTVPGTVADAVLARVARLSARARDLLELVSLSPGGLEPAIAGVIVDDATEALDECAERGVLVISDGRATFRHELARRAVEAAVPAGTARERQRRLLEVLETTDAADRARLAHHADAAGQGERVVRHARVAALEAATRGAHVQAAAQFARVLKYEELLQPEERAGTLEALSIEQQIIGRIPEAISSRQAALRLRRELGHRLREGEDLYRLAQLCITASRTAEAESASHDAVTLLEGEPDCAELGAAYAVQAYLRMIERDCEDAIAWGERALEVGERWQEIQTLAYAHNAIGAAYLVSDVVDSGVAHMLESLRLARESGRDQLLAGSVAVRGSEAGISVVMDRGVAQVLESLRFARESGRDQLIAGALVVLGSGAGEVYQTELADRYLTETIAYDAERDIDDTYAHSWLALIRLYQGRWDEANEEAAIVLGRAHANPIGQIMALLALGRLRTRRGDAGAGAALDDALAIAAEGASLQRLAPIHAARAELAWLAGDVERTRAEGDAVYEHALAKRHAWFVGELAYWQWKAGVEREVPPWAAAPFALQISGRPAEAAALWAERGCAYEAARARSESEQEAELRAALATFMQLGAEPAADRVRATLRTAGAKDVPPRPRASTRAAPAQLTRRQLEVLELLEGGLSNAEIAGRLFITEKTASHHVSAILRKLDARSRAEAGAKARKMRILATPT
jgi:DNA-binding CsgD family transcriptional regulator/tetratricopeptide (TPR) repeat protein